jgi:hypothetical protein
MTPKQTKALGQHIHALAHHLGLSDWDIRLTTEPCGDGKAASVSCTYGRRIAHVSLASDWWAMPAEERHHVLVHELLHIITDPLRTYLDEMLPGMIGGPAYSAASDAIRQHEEHAVDQIASALAPMLPVMEDV